MKKLLIALFIISLIFSISLMEAQTAPKRGSKGGIKAEELTKMSNTVDNLTKKVYANSLFSPKENEELISIKIRLDNQMLINADLTLAPLYYKAGNLYKLRDYKVEAIDCYQTILENFADTALAPKAKKELLSLGVVIKEETPAEDENADEETEE